MLHVVFKNAMEYAGYLCNEIYEYLSSHLVLFQTLNTWLKLTKH